MIKPSTTSTPPEKKRKIEIDNNDLTTRKHSCHDDLRHDETEILFQYLFEFEKQRGTTFVARKEDDDLFTELFNFCKAKVCHPLNRHI